MGLASGAARTRLSAEPTHEEAALAAEAQENLANISLALPPQVGDTKRKVACI